MLICQSVLFDFMNNAIIKIYILLTSTFILLINVISLAIFSVIMILLRYEDWVKSKLRITNYELRV